MRHTPSGLALTLLGASALLSLVSASPAALADEGFFWDGGFTGLGANTVARAINDNSEIAGSVGGLAAVWQSGAPTLLDSSGYISSIGLDINNSGQVAGFGRTVNDLLKPVVWSSGVKTELPTLGGTQGVATSINNAGTAVGYSMSPGGVMNASRWSSGAVSGLGFAPSLASQAFGVNNSGQIVGVVNRRGFLWSNGVVTDLGVNVYPLAINDAGQIAGYSLHTSNRPEAFVWDSVQGLQSLSFMDGLWSKAFGINNSGQVVGFSQELFDSNYVASTTTVTHAILWQDNTVTDIGTLHGSYSIAYGINSQGQIVGIVPEPGGAVALAVGLIGFAGVLFRRVNKP